MVPSQQLGGQSASSSNADAPNGDHHGTPALQACGTIELVAVGIGVYRLDHNLHCL